MKKIYIIIFSLIVLAGCQSLKNLSPTEVLKNSIEQPNQINFYAKGTSKMKLIDEELDIELEIEEWRSDDKQRLVIDDGEEITTSITDGLDTLSYDESSTEAYLANIGHVEYELLQPKEEMDSILDDLYETHAIERKGEEKIADRKTFHLLATPRSDQDDTIYNIWVDKQYWVILKMELEADELYYKTEYDYIEFNPEFAQNIFELKAPSGYNVNKVNNSSEREEMTLEDMVDEFGDDFLYFPSNDDFELKEIYREHYGFSDEGFVEYVFFYEKDDQDFLEMSIFPVEEPEEEAELLFDDYTFEVRDTVVTVAEDVNFVSWREDNFIYMVDYFDKTITISDLEKWIKSMERPLYD